MDDNKISKPVLEPEVLERVRQAMDVAYAPYSGFQVGAVIVGANGNLYSGCNVENASYPEGCCAETSAISAMVLDGERSIASLALMGKGGDDTVLVTPCGGCRQRIREFAKDDTPIYLCSQQGEIKMLTLGELLPHSFGAKHFAPPEDRS